MKIIADEQIPLLNELYGNYAQVEKKLGRSITHDDLIDAQMLLVRTITRVNQSLLSETGIKFPWQCYRRTRPH